MVQRIAASIPGAETSILIVLSLMLLALSIMGTWLYMVLKRVIHMPADFTNLNTAVSRNTAETNRAVPGIKPPAPDVQPSIDAATSSINANSDALKAASDAAGLPPTP